MGKNVFDFGNIGGTMVSAIVGLNPWKSALGAYLELRHEVSPTPDNPAMERGRRYESVVADIFQNARIDEYRVVHNRQGTDEPERYEHPEYHYLIGHPDRLLYDTKNNELVAGLEIKTSNWSNVRNWGEEGTDSIPQHYLIQCQWYAGLANLPVWQVAVAFLDDSGTLRQYKEFKVKSDKQLFDTLVERAVEFWEDHVVPGIPPEMDMVDDTTARWIVERYPRNTVPMEVATAEEEQVMERLIALQEKAKQAQAELESVENELKLMIGERDGLQSEKLGKVTWKRSKDSTRVDYKGVCSELDVDPKLIERYTKQVEGTRRFVTSGLKKQG